MKKIGLVDRLGNPLRSVRKHSPLEVESWHESNSPGFYPTTSPENMTRISWVYACVGVKARAVKATPLRTYLGEDGDEPETGGPLYEKLKSPNPFMSGRKLLEGTAQWLDIHGNAFWWLEGAGKGSAPMNIWLLDSHNVVVVGDRKNYVAGYIHELNGRRIPLDVREVIHFKQFNPFDIFYGLGTIQAAGPVLATENQRRTYEDSFFKNGARLSGILSAPDRVDDAVFERVKAEWLAMHRGARNAHKTAVLEQGMKYQPVTISQKDMEFMEMARFNRDQILAMFGVPPSKLGLVEDANRSNSDQQDKTFWENIQSILADIEDTINNHPTIQAMTPERVRFDEVVTEDMGDKVDRVVKLAAYDILDKNELRDILGYKPVKDNVVNPTNPMLPDALDDTGNEPGEGGRLQRIAKAINDKYKRNHEREIERFTEEFTQEIQTFFDEQEMRIIKRLNRRNLDKSKVPRDDQLEDLLVYIFNMETENRRARELMRPIYYEVAKAAYEKVTDSFFETDKRWSKDNPEHASVIRALARKVKGINETTREEIREQIREGMERGYSIQQIAEGVPEEDYPGIAGVFRSATGSRAETIARTETANAYNLANLRSYMDHGLANVLVMDGTQNDEACRRANGQIWTIKKAFKNPTEHPNCRRAFAPVPADLLGKAKGKEVMEWGWKIIRKLAE